MSLQLEEKDQKIFTKGVFSVYRIMPDGTYELAFSDRNQIQYIGAYQIANALSSSTYPMPTLSGIIASIVDPVNDVPLGSPLGNPRTVDNQITPSGNNDSTFTVDLVSSSFKAVHSSSPGDPQTIVCEGILMNTNLAHTERFFQFGLIVTGLNPVTGQSQDTMLAYKYVSGGVSWGIATGLSVLWTLYLGV